jgi:putative membrane protein
MQLTASIIVGIVAALHFLIAGVEMFFWTKPRVYRRLKGLNILDAEARKIAPIVANAGLYNAFIAAGLVWSLTLAADVSSAKYFFLACVVIAGLFGAATLSWKTLVLQTLPACFASILVWMASNPI